MRRIITVTPNPALDMTWQTDAAIPGGSHRVDAAGVRAGGKGINVARVAHAEGYAATAITTSGGHVGAEFAAELTASGLPHRLVPVAGETRRSAAIYDRSAADTMIFNERGVGPSAEEWRALIAAVEAELSGTAELAGTAAERADATAERAGTAAGFAAAEPVGVLTISGSMPPGIGADDLSALMKTAADHGIPVIVDTSGPLLLDAAAAGAALLKPNREELAAATGEADPLRGIAVLLDRGAGAVLCSLGADGMLLASRANETERTGRSARRARLTEALEGNPTGAGDAAVAAAATLAAEGIRLDDVRVLERAVAWSAAAVLMPLAGEISSDRSAIEQRIVVDAVEAKNAEAKNAEEGASA